MLRRRSLPGCLSVWLALLAGTLWLRAETVPIPDSPNRWVTDTAGFLSPGAVSTLDARLQAYQQISGHQLLVYVAPSSGDAPIEDWAVRAFQRWKVGRKGLDDGLVLFIMARDHKLRIEVGYGLEPVVPDAIASRLIREVIAPKIQQGDADGAVTAAIDSLTGVIGGQSDALPAGSAPGASTRTQHPQQPLSTLQMILFGVVGVLVLLFLITHPSLAFFFLSSMMSGGGGGGFGGGGGGGGGGFSGGGGRSGGGGASGSW